MNLSVDHSLFQSLQKAWVLRWNQHIEESMGLLADIQMQEKWDQLDPEQLKTFPQGPSRENYLEALLLKGSFLRAQGQEQKSSAWLRRVLNKNTELRDSKSFRLFFELGLDSWRSENVAEALDSFLLAEKKARSSVEKVFALSNVLWCLEALDLPRQSVENKLQDMLLKTQELSLKHVEEQWKSYQIRKKFYTHLQIPPEKDLSGQALFLKMWLTELPYTEQKNSLLEDWDSHHLWQSSYRFRTLAGIWSPQDRSVVRVGDAIDRLYLWVWKWMANQEEMSLEKNLWTLESILLNLELSEQSQENKLLLRNAGSWLVLFEPTLKKKVGKILDRLQKVSSARYPVLEEEFNLIQCLSEKDGKDLVSGLKRFSVFSKIYQGEFLPHISSQVRNKKSLSRDKDIKITVDLQTEIITFHQNQLQIHSRRMCQLVALLIKYPSISFDQIETSVDPRSIYNLVSRLKKYFPKNSIRIEKQKIYRGSSWPKIDLVNQSALFTESLDELGNFDFTDSLKPQFVGSEAHLQAAKALLPEKFGRLQLQKVLAVSKATACRMIEEWFNEGLIAKQGQGKNIFYQWSQEKFQ